MFFERGNQLNPWLDIQLQDYEGHMSLPSVGQARLLADYMGSVVERLRPKSVAVIGCAGGNGFDRISPELVQRVVGLDINPEYIAEARGRFNARFKQLELLCRDFLDDNCPFEPVDLVIADLVFEYVDPKAGLKSIKRFVRRQGHLSTILQLPSETIPAVTPSPFTSLNKLSSILHLVPPDEFEKYAEAVGFKTLERKQWGLATGKEFHQVLLQIPG